MQKLQTINKKIAALQKQRDALERQAALALFHHLKEILQDDFDSHLVLGLVKDAWHSRTALKVADWKSTAHPFRKPHPSPQKNPTKNAAPVSP